ncbi:S41 family peptidase [Polaribacter sp. SA4-12]|uniref:S41 family peptidase n=1 Tax=Polaribacter sp. SA4-12 TaxID=1312072 RepID=UPI000B3CAE91|nr:S41 family peptidase [Polaribacter sp. SA4-12]ARV14211.1 peptidase S41 [Polaribacter sp. SA4-12]
MRKIIKLSLLSIVLFVASCSKSDDSSIEPNVTDDINYFIWKGMNSYYFWQKEVPDLANNRFSDFDDVYAHFRGYSSPEDSFNSLIYQDGISDRFSWIVDDYVALENSFEGINQSTGMEFGLKRNSDSNTNVFGYIRYVIPNTDAASKGVTRGMIFNTVNGTQITDSNYTNLLFSDNTSLNVGFADYNSGNPTSNGTTVTLTKEQVSENPVAISKVIDEGTKKIGYLLYNQFSSSYDGQLNTAFNSFKAEGVNELIIDLRYNGGGAVSTATYLGSMITGQFNGELYSKEVWNDKVQAALDPDLFLNYFTNEIRNTDQNGNIILQESINSLNLSTVYFIVSGSTASASELVINSLRAYIDVKIVGTTTVGKQVGSITLYDSDNLSRSGDNLSTEHTYAMQPIVLEISNKDNKNEAGGFVPGVTVPGIQLAEDYGNLGVLGERSDPLLDRTIIYITTGARGTFKNSIQEYSEIYNSKLATPASNNMYSEFKR